MNPRLIVTLVAFRLSAVLAFPGYDLHAFEIEIQNATGYDFYIVHAFSHDAREMGPNIIDRPIFEGSTRHVRVDDTTQRIYVVDEDGDRYLVSGLGPRERTQIIVSLDDLFYGDPLSRGRPDSLIIINETGYAIVSVEIRPVAVGTGHQGTELLPASQVLPRGRSFVATVPPEYEADDLFHLRLIDEDGDIYEERRIDFRVSRVLSFTVDDIRW